MTKLPLKDNIPVPSSPWSSPPPAPAVGGGLGGNDNPPAKPVFHREAWKDGQPDQPADMPVLEKAPFKNLR